MKVKERRELLLSILNKSAKPIKGDELANTLNVSRQVIVQDIALIRATGVDIIATPQGYVIYNTKVTTKTIECKNHVNGDEFYNELSAITLNKYKNGEAYYIGTGVDNNIMDLIAKKIIVEADIEAIESPKGVEVVKRKVNDEEYYFIMNHTAEGKIFNNINLKAYESKIVKIK